MRNAASPPKKQQQQKTGFQTFQFKKKKDWRDT